MRWIVTRDMPGRYIDFIETTEEDAREAYLVKCDELQAEGWVLEGGRYDWQFAHRGRDRVRVGVERYDPRVGPPVVHSTP